MTEEIKRPRGRPRQLIVDSGVLTKVEPESTQADTPQPMKKAAVVSESWYTDDTEVKNPDQEKHYSWARQSSDRDMNNCLKLNYSAARGEEKIMGNPMISTENGSGIDGEIKTRGDRILMCCPKAEYEARQRAKMAKRLSPKDAAEHDARKINSGLRGTGVQVIPEGKTETISNI